MFWLASKIFWLLVQPTMLIGIVLLLGLVLTFRRRKGFGQALVALGLVLWGLVGFTSLGILMMQPLENRYARPAAFPDDAAGLIVLGGGGDGRVGAARGAYELGEAGDRLVEAVRLKLAHPGLPVVVSGGIGALDGNGDTDAKGAARLLEAFGVNGADIRTESISRDTYENAVETAALVVPRPGQRFVLLTSAYHMPRAVAVFERAGFAVVPWPVDYRTSGTDGFRPSLTEPNLNFAIASAALREWIGLYVYWMTGRIDHFWP